MSASFRADSLPAPIQENSSSFPRKRESREGGFEEAFLDSRLRGNDEEKVAPPCPHPNPPPAGEGEKAALRRALVNAASARYRPAGRFAYQFARGKLGMDPLFIDLLRLGVLPPQARFLDLGCGQAVLAAWLLAAREHFESGQWPAGWPEPPRLLGLHGLELMPRDVARAVPAFAGEPRVRVEQADICERAFEPADVVTIFDVLHYFDPPRQADVLRRIRAALGPGGLLLARVGDAAGGLRFDLSRWADQVITFVRGHGFSPMHCRPVAAWGQALEALGFQVRIAPTEGGLPFANTMLIARVPLAGERNP